MTCKIVYVAVPPQLKRVVNYDAGAGGYLYLIGDRITALNSIGPRYRTFSCTTSGRHTELVTSAATTSNSTITLGTAVFTDVVDEGSWANARTIPFSNDTDTEAMVVDYQYTSTSTIALYSGDKSSLVFVDPVTMKPMNWMFKSSNFSFSKGSHIFFGNDLTGGYYAKSHLSGEEAGDTNAVLRVGTGSVLYGQDSTVTNSTLPVPAKVIYKKVGTAITGYGTGTASGMNIYDPGNRISYIGRTVETASASEAGMFYVQQATAFTWPQTTSWVVPSAGDNVFPGINRLAMIGAQRRQAGARGYRCTAAEITTIYRDTSFSAADHKYALDIFCATKMYHGIGCRLPTFTIANTLTGARTVTVRMLVTGPQAAMVKNNVLFIEVSYPSSATMADYTLATSADANFGMYESTTATLVTIDETSAGWTYPGDTYPSGAISLTRTISPARAGPVYVRVSIYTSLLSKFRIYVDPMVGVS